MTTDDLLTTLHDEILSAPAWVPGVAVVLALGLLYFLARRLARWGHGRLARIVQVASTGLGLAWSAQGMYDVATDKDHYHLPTELAVVLCVIFEVYLVNRMLVTERYRAGDRLIRARHVKSVVVAGVVMALVVALGEGWAQAPARLAVPLLVVYGWFMDLTADDRPEEAPETSWRWTSREIGLKLRLLKYTEKDQQKLTNAERTARTLQMARLAFALQFGTEWVSDILRRKSRLARLRLLADDDQIAEVTARLVRAKGNPAPTGDPEPEPKREPEPRRREIDPPPKKPAHPSGATVRMVDGQALAGDDLKEHAIGRLLASVTPERPSGMSTEELIKSYDPPLGKRTAEGWAAAARKRARVNGSEVDHLVP